MIPGPTRQDTALAAAYCALALAAAVCRPAMAEPAANRVPAPDPATRITQYVHDVWQTEDGLPASEVQGIVHARDGYLWLATRAGLVRFDGVGFRVFNRVNTPVFGIDDLTTLVEGPDGSFWIGSRGAGLYRYRQGRFSAFPAPDPASSDLRALVIDHAGELWAASLGGLLRFSGGKLNAVGEPTLATAEVRALYQDREATLWIGTAESGIYSYRDGRFSAFASADELSSAVVNDVLRDRTGALWVATAKGLKRFAGGGVTVFRRPDGLIDDDVRALYEDAAGSLWIGTANGFVRFRDGRFESFAEHAGVTADLVRTILVDREGSLWIGTNGSGLHRFKVGPITAYSTREGLTHDGVWSIAGDGSGRLLVGFGDGGIDQLEKGTVSPLAPAAAFSRSPVYSLLEDSSGVLWAGTEVGLASYREGRLRLYTAADGLPDDFVRIVYRDPRAEGVLWLGTLAGLGRFQDGAFRHWDTSSGLPDDSVRALLKDRQGALWIGTENGLARLEAEELTVYSTADGLAANAIRALFEDARGTLWIGTRGGGIARRVDGRLVAYTSRQGLPHNDAWAILEDDFGNLWWSSDQGLVRVRKADFDAFDHGDLAAIPARVFGLDDGMKSAECNGVGFPSGWKSDDGKLFFASMGGVVQVDPRPGQPGAPARADIDALLVDDLPIDIEGPVELRPDQRNLQLTFTSPQLRDPGGVRLSYRLSPFDPDWIDAGSRRSAFYTNLPPGRYEFRVNAGKGEAGNGATLAFVVRPYVYETWWFRTAGVLALGCAVYQGVVWWTRSIRDRNRRLQEEIDRRRRVESELEVKVAELAAKNGDLERFTYTVSHDLKAPLVTIRGFLGLVKRDAEAGDIRRLADDLTRIDTAAESMAGLLEDLLTLSRIGLESRPPQNVALGELVHGALERIAGLVRERGVAVEIASDLPTVQGDPARLMEVFQNLLENAVKYMGDEKAPRVEVGTRRDGPEPTLYVRDNGMGIDPEYHEKIFGLFERLETSAEGTGIGLALVRRIVESHGGRIWVESSGPTRGSTFCLSLPYADNTG